MPIAPITGTVVWTADVSTAGLGNAMRLGLGVVDAAEAFGYFPDKQLVASSGTRTIYRLKRSDRTWVRLYAASFFANPIDSLSLSADGLTLYATSVNGGTAFLYSCLADGTSGAPTTVASWVFGSTAPSFLRTWLDPTTGYLFGVSSGGTGLYYLDPANVGAAPVKYFQVNNGEFVAGVGPARYDPTGRLLWGGTNNFAAYGYELFRPNWLGQSKAFVGDGTAAFSAPTLPANSYTLKPGAVTHLDSDESEHIYYMDGAPRIRRRDPDGTVSDVVGLVTVAGGFRRLPTANVLWVCNGSFEVREVS